MPSHLTEAREEFLRQRARVSGDDDGPAALDPDDGRDAPVIEALSEFANAADPERSRPVLRKPRADRTLRETPLSNASAAEYLKVLRIIHQRGFDLLGGSAEEYNDFMADMVDGVLPDYDGSIMRTTAGKYQSAARAFYRFCTEPGVSDDRPEVRVEWPATDIIVFSDQSEPRHDEGDMFDDEEVNALREACLRGMNPRRDRAFIEILAGTCQRITAVRTLLVRDVFVDPGEETPHVLLNPEIRGDGDKGAIEAADRWRPIVSDVGPIREWVQNHPLRDPDVREEHGAPDSFGECYLFVGDITNGSTDASRPWDYTAIWNMLNRRKENTAKMPNVVTVSKPVDPHNFRHWGYSKSKELPIDEDVRRKIFGWRPGSDTGDEVYGHVGAEQSGRQFAEEWNEAFGGEGDVAGVTEAIIGEIAAGNIPPETARAIVQAILNHEGAKQELVDGLLASAN